MRYLWEYVSGEPKHKRQNLSFAQEQANLLWSVFQTNKGED